ncbi:lipopolysaccharide biosynthesis protein RfbH [Bradyrhizobium yuanmingense]|uniref:lipopolysaccharide biosynthesis protein RfbH n=1 Tax=Bradyrhizobium yuanmingense TaxID=108015 RepID=UPI0021A4EC29|nr:lipopolysaccharide biosynthesis protein RfbH [Bradyrhizobium sp. CB1024]UWU83209.1 lipopolysaccharide biosynthesis protein RfbH [Bradyrhizobium sp. CB1024]
MTIQSPPASEAIDPPRQAEDIRRQIHQLVERHYELTHALKAFSAGHSSVPISGRVFDATDVKHAVDAALEFWLTAGHFNDEFQAKLAQRVGAPYALTVNSGSSANLVAFSALTSPLLRERRLQPGSEIITAATGFPTTVNPSILWGMTPVFIDIDIPSYNVTPELVEAAITPQTRVIMAAHTLGNPFDAARIAEVARRHNLFFIEDCCDALGATLNGRHVGTFGDIGTLSFYPAHHITMGEGGAAFTSHPGLRRAMETFRDWGRDCYCNPGKDDTCNRRFGWQLSDLPHGYDHKYTYGHLGFNLKITDMQAAIGLAQLAHLEDFIAARRRNFDSLKHYLRELEDFFILPDAAPNSEPSWFGFLLTVRESAPFSRDEIVRYLNFRKIGTRLLFGGNLTRQPYMQNRHYRVHGKLTNSDRVMNQTFWIGVYPGLGAAEIDYVTNTIGDFCRAPGRHQSRE